MKKVVLALALGFPGLIASGANFTVGNVVVYRVGTGSAALSGAATAVFLDEFNSTGTLVQSVALPTAASGATKACTAAGTATSEGLLTLSGNATYLALGCYDATPGTATPNSTAPATINRVVARVDSAATVDTTTALNDPTGNIRGAYTSNGTDVWMTTSSNGLRYTTIGTTGGTTSVYATVANLRGVVAYAGQLYVSTGSGTTFRIGSVGTGLPTTAGQTVTTLPSFPTNSGGPYSFFMFDLNGPVAGLDTLWVADNTLNQLQKYSLVAGNWVSNGTIAVAGGIVGLAGRVVSAPGVELYLTTGSTLYRITDSTGYNGALTGTPSTVATAGTNTAFRGVAFAPGTTLPVELTHFTIE